MPLHQARAHHPPASSIPAGVSAQSLPLTKQHPSGESQGNADVAHELAAACVRLKRRLASASPPLVTTHFILGPWAQVCAQQAAMRRSDSAAANDAMDVAIDLIWSTDAARSRADSPTLAAMIPCLVERLDAGMTAAGVPSRQREAWLDQFAGLHMETMRRTTGSGSDSGPITVDLKLDEEWPGVDEYDAAVPIPEPPPTSEVAAPAVPGSESEPEPEPKVGDTFSLQLQEKWVAAKLLWISGNGKFLFFTSAHGSGSHSFTRRTFLKMRRDGLVRPIQTVHPLFAGAIGLPG